MDFPKLLQRNIIAVAFILAGHAALGQLEIKGTIYDRSERFPMQGVSVIGTSGYGTITDSSGHYHIKLPAGDSIYFSYLGKFTAKFPVNDIPADQPFDMSLEVAIESLPSVLVRPRDYFMDSLQNRTDYQKIFNYGGPGYLDNMKMKKNGGIGIGLDLDKLFDVASNRRELAFQQRLEEEERNNYIDHRFSRSLVKKITGLEPPALDTFMHQYRPSYEFIQSCVTDYEFYKYIFDWGKTFAEIWKNEHPN